VTEVLAWLAALVGAALSVLASILDRLQPAD
jgi:hypothetical protein